MLGSSLQENIICLLVYDDVYSTIIRNSVTTNLYGGAYRLLASRIYEFIDNYNKPPKEHLPDILADKLSSGTSESQLYSDIIDSVHGAYLSINKEYVVNQLELFVKRQSLRAISVDLTKALQKDTEESLEEASSLLEQANKQSLKVFDPGLKLSDKAKALDFLTVSNECLPTGIIELDKRGFGPTRKELWLAVANTKGGKSWLLTHLAKMALSHRYKVVHITLEMSDIRVSQRYFQALFSIAKRENTNRVTKFRYDQLGRLTGFDDVNITPKLRLTDTDIREKLEKIIDKWSVRLLDNIYIKEFPTGQLTIPQLKSYLDNLEATQKFTPDLLVVDYPDLMKLDKTNLRLSIDETYKELRGIAVERNTALAIVSQSHRSAAKSKVIDSSNVAEAYSKIAHADCVVTLTSTEAEKKLGLARLYVSAGRNDADGVTIVISQNYNTGTFVVDQTLMPSDYWSNFEGEQNGDES